MLTTALNVLVLLRIIGLQLAHEPGWEGFGPLVAVLAVIGVLIGVLSWTSQRTPQALKHIRPARYLLRARQKELTPR